MTINFCLPVRPTTKKTSSKIASFGKPCRVCKKYPFSKIVPSDLFAEFETVCLLYGPRIRQELNDALTSKGFPGLPITGPISVRACFFREADIGDAVGYYQALGDVLQAPRYKDGKQTRKGLGVIDNDSQIRDWDGSRLSKDPSRPRIEVVITTIDPPLFGGSNG